MRLPPRACARSRMLLNPNAFESIGRSGSNPAPSSVTVRHTLNPLALDTQDDRARLAMANGIRAGLPDDAAERLDDGGRQMNTAGSFHLDVRSSPYGDLLGGLPEHGNRLVVLVATQHMDSQAGFGQRPIGSQRHLLDRVGSGLRTARPDICERMKDSSCIKPSWSSRAVRWRSSATATSATPVQ